RIDPSELSLLKRRPGLCLLLRGVAKMKVRTLTRGVSQEDKPVASQPLPCKLGSGKLVHKVAVICLKRAPNIASSPLSCSQTWSATALSRNATRKIGRASCRERG